MTVTSVDLLVDSFGRIDEEVAEVLDGLSDDELAVRVDDGANSIGWLVWHLSRIQDNHVADAAGTPEVWSADGWEKRFSLPYSAGATGYGHSPEDVAAFRDVSGELLAQYHRAVHEQTLRYLGGLADGDFERIVDDAWDPPVTLGVRLVSVVSDDLQHVGQAAFVRGLVRRRGTA